MKTTLIAMLVIGLVAAHSAFGQDWEKWSAEFESLARSKGLRHAQECTSYTVGGDKHPERLRWSYSNGLTVAQAFDAMGCDIEVFEQVWMMKLRHLAKAEGINVPQFDEKGGEALEEYFWLHFFTEGKSPQSAIPYLYAK